MSDVIAQVYEGLGHITYFNATSGTTTTAVNTKTGYTDSSLIGTLFIKRTSDGLAPQGEYSVLNSYNRQNGTFTTTDTLTAAVGAGDRFGYISPIFSLDQVLSFINTALLEEFPYFPQVDTSLTTAGSQTEYTLPVTLKYEIIGVEVQTDNTDSNDNRYVEVSEWAVIPSTAGSTGTLVLPQFSSGYTIRIWYKAPHPAVNAFDDVIDERVHPILLKWAVITQCYEWKNGRERGKKGETANLLNDARDQLFKAKSEYAYVANTPRRKAKGLQLGRTSSNLQRLNSRTR
jgi:hypothetical protein